MTDAIRTQGLSKDYGGGRGLFDLDLQVPAGHAATGGGTVILRASELT
jgi:hypothetical protein